MAVQVVVDIEIAVQVVAGTGVGAAVEVAAGCLTGL